MNVHPMRVTRIDDFLVFCRGSELVRFLTDLDMNYLGGARNSPTNQAEVGRAEGPEITREFCGSPENSVAGRIGLRHNGSAEGLPRR